MKQKYLAIIVLAVGLVASCSQESESLDTTNPMEKNLENMDEILARTKGKHSLSWIVDGQVVDTATFDNTYVTTGKYTKISHFPIVYLLKFFDKQVEPADITYNEDQFNWLMDLNIVGYSESNFYLYNYLVFPKVTFKIKGENYTLFIYSDYSSNVNDRHTSIIYDLEKDMWTGVVLVNKLQLTSWYGYSIISEQWDRTFTEPINMTFQTTGRKK